MSLRVAVAYWASASAAVINRLEICPPRNYAIEIAEFVKGRIDVHSGT